MPLPIAHGLLGASAVAALHPRATKRFYIPLFIGAFLANAADFDFLFVFIFRSKDWHRGFSHSIAFALVVFLIFVLCLGKRKIREAAAYALAFASHCILDFMTTVNGGGVELLSPFSSERFAFGWRGLSETPSKLSAAEIAQTLGVEFLLFAPLLFFILFLRNYFSAEKSVA